MMGFFINILPMKSFKTFISEAIARRPDKISVRSLSSSAKLIPDENGYIHITTYHGGHFGESEGETPTPEHIRFQNINEPSQWTRPSLKGKIITHNQPISSFSTFSTTPNAEAAITYRGQRFKGREKLYEIGVKVHKDNVLHLRTFHDYNQWFNGTSDDSPFKTMDYQNHLFNHPKYGSTFREFHRTTNKLNEITKEINSRHAEWERNLPELPDEKDYEKEYDQYQTRMQLSHNKKMEMFEQHPEYEKVRQERIKSIENLKKHFLPSNEVDVWNSGIDPIQFAHAQMKTDYAVNKLGIHAIVMSDGSGTARNSGEVHILHPSAIQSVTDRTDEMDAVRDRYHNLRGTEQFKRLIGPARVNYQVARGINPPSLLGQRNYRKFTDERDYHPA